MYSEYWYAGYFDYPSELGNPFILDCLDRCTDWYAGYEAARQDDENEAI